MLRASAGSSLTLFKRHHPLDGLLPVLRARAAIRDARHPHLVVGLVAAAASRPHQLALNRDALVRRGASRAGAAGGWLRGRRRHEARRTRTGASRCRFTMSSPRDLLGHLHLAGANGHRRHALRGAAVAEKHQHAAGERALRPAAPSFLFDGVGLAELGELAVLVVDERRAARRPCRRRTVPAPARPAPSRCRSSATEFASCCAALAILVGQIPGKRRGARGRGSTRSRSRVRKVFMVLSSFTSGPSRRAACGAAG